MVQLALDERSIRASFAAVRSHAGLSLSARDVATVPVLPSSLPPPMTNPPNFPPRSADAPTSGEPAPVIAEKTLIWEDFVDIFYAPSSVFARREKGSPWPPILVVTILLGLLFYANSGVLEPIMDAEFRRGMATAMRDNPQLTPEMIERSRGFTEMFTKVGVFIVMPITIFLIGLALWLCGKIVDAKQTLKAAVVVAAYSYMPRVLESLIVGLQGLLMDVSRLTGRYQVTLSAARFSDPETTSPALLAILGRFDVFIIWVTVLLAIGLAVTGKIPRGKAAIAAFLVWILGALPTVLPALRQ